MSEELHSNERWVEKHFTPLGFELLTSLFITINTAGSAIWPLFLLCCNRLYISNKFKSEWEQKRSLKNEERKRVKVMWEVKECSRRKAQNGQAKDKHKKDQHVYNNCYELRSSAIKNE